MLFWCLILRISKPTPSNTNYYRNCKDKILHPVMRRAYQENYRWQINLSITKSQYTWPLNLKSSRYLKTKYEDVPPIYKPQPFTNFFLQIINEFMITTWYTRPIGGRGFPSGSVVKNLVAMQEMQFRSPGQEGPLEEEMATHSSIPAWEMPWTEKPGGL